MVCCQNAAHMLTFTQFLNKILITAIRHIAALAVCSMVLLFIISLYLAGYFLLNGTYISPDVYFSC
jgi:hypothetical protein